MFNYTKIVLAGALSVVAASSHAALSVEEENAFIDILSCFERVDNTLVVNGCNVQVVNGSNSSTTSNGKGNVIIGYNKPLLGEGATPDYRSGSHNLVIGDLHTYKSEGGVIVGESNSALAPGVAVAGVLNTAKGMNSSVWGGARNTAEGDYSSILGGELNKTTTDALYSTIAGGYNNTVSSTHANISGGADNEASAVHSNVIGGESNKAQGAVSSVAGGEANVASGDQSAVLGGRFNQADGEASAIGGGKNRVIGGQYDYKGGYFFSGQ
ncbi:hypothetical protein HR060_11560 [Catenovulum sp. SM1970]|uniref:hypothetical protein n=1 Tax=Marinifaba aquimaris TaxID=2741323 RepID=UPI00157414CB|nr:hypothetical protein [Marinifaba aquimaris]NTS77499.1 hypothetical protein [Marinifaba aquimaris]